MVDKSNIEDFLSELDDIASKLSSSVARAGKSVEDFNGDIEDLSKSISEKGRQNLLKFKRDFADITKSAAKNLNDVQKSMNAGLEVSVPDFSPMISQLESMEQQIISNGDLSSKEKKTRLTAVLKEKEALSEMQHKSEMIAANFQGANDQARKMSRNFLSFVDRIPYVGTMISEKLNLTGIREDLMVNLRGPLNEALSDPKKILPAIKKMGTATFSAIGQAAKAAFSNPLTILAVLAALSIKRFFDLEASASNFRKETGLAADQTRLIERIAQNINVEYEHMGVSIEGVYKSLAAITDEFGSMLLISKEFTRNVALFSSAMGVSEKSSVGFAKNLASIASVSADTASNMQGWVYQLAKTAKVSPVKVIEDIASASDDTLIAFGGFPDKLAKAAVQARLLGSNINDMSKTTRGLLNFQSSISSEMEAATLLGRNLNLQRARQLRFEGKVVEAQQEVLRVVRRAGDLNKMNVFQQEALAKATGMSVDEMRKQLTIQDNLKRLGRDINDLDKEAIEALAAKKGMSQDELEILSRQSDQRSAQAKMMAELKSLGTSLAQIMVPIVSVVTAILIPIFKVLGTVVRAALAPFIWAGKAFNLIQDSVRGTAGEVKAISSFGNRFFQSLLKVLKVLGEIAGIVGAVWALALVPAWGPVAAVITGIVGSMYLIWKYGKDVMNVLVKGIMIPVKMIREIFYGLVYVFEPLVDAIMDAGKVVLKAFLIPFQIVWEIIKGVGSSLKFVGQLLIGFGTMMFKIWVLPFQIAAMSIKMVWGMLVDVAATIVDIGIQIGKYFLLPARLIINIFTRIGNLIKGLFKGNREAVERDLFGPIRAFGKFFMNTLDMGISLVKSTFGFIGKIVHAAIITPFKIVFGVVRGIMGAIEIVIKNVISPIGDLIFGIGGIILKFLFLPMRMVFGIIRGIAGAIMEISKTMWDTGKMVFDAILTPFKMVYSAITSVIDYLKNMFGGVENSGRKSVGVIGGIVKTIIGAFEGVYNFFVKTISGISKAITFVLSAPFKIIGFIVQTAAKIFGGFIKTFLTPILSVGVAIGKTIVNFILLPFKLLIGAAKLFWSIVSENVKTFVSIGKMIFNFIVSPFKFVFNLISKGIQFVKSLFGGFAKDSEDKVKKSFFNPIAFIGKFFLKVITGVYNFIVGTFKAVGNIIFTAFTAPFKFIKSAIESTISLFKSTGEGILSIFKNIGLTIFNFITAPFRAIFNFITAPFRAVYDFITSIFNSAGDGILSKFLNIGKGIFNFITSPFTKAFEFIKNAFSGVKDFFGSIFGGLGEIIMSPFTAVKGFITGIFDKISGALTNFGGLLNSLFLQPIKWAWDKVGGMIDSLFGEKSKTDPTASLADSLSKMSEEKLGLMKDVALLLSSDALSENILKTAKSIDNLAESINSISAVKILALSAFKPAETQKPEETSKVVNKEEKAGNNDQIVEKLSELISLMKSGGIAVNLDGRKVSQQLATKVR